MVDAVVGVLLDYTVKPILHQLDYLVRYNGNIKEVEKKLGALETTKDNVQILVSQDKGKGNAIFDGVRKWLNNVNEVLDMTQQNEASNPSCFNCIQRHQLSRKAKKRLENIVELLNEGRQFNKDNVGYPVPCPDTNSSTLPADYQMFESRTLITEKIKGALVNPDVHKVGVCGMGGVGKSALLNEVKKLVLENNLFDRVIKVEVGQSKSVFKIQEEIGDKLNIKLNMQSDEVRASRLQTHIAERKEKILFMLDDLWKDYDVEKEFGIPCRSKSSIEGTCKIVMTGRRRDLFRNQMNTEKLFEVNPLTEKESWRFFVAIVGDELAEDGYMQQIGNDVVKECGGLPIALEIVAKALKGKRVEIWKDALKKLKNPVVVDIHGVSDQLYSCLQLSYDSIEDEAKLILLLCSVFPDDHKIDVKDLQMYAMGMRLLNHINTWEDARNRVIKLVDDLKSSYLLLDSDEWDDNYVKMHDVVHDFTKYIASKIDKMSSLTYGSGQREWEEHKRHGYYNAIYVDCTSFLTLPPKLEFPNLQLFILSRNRRSLITGHSLIEPCIEISDTFFEGMEELRALNLRMMRFAPSSWTSSTHSLKGLHTLYLCFCKCGNLQIGELKKLEILMIISCEIQELPVCMAELTQLKVLRVLNCYHLKVIHTNIISKMTRLEELSLWKSFKRWGAEVSYKNKMITNAKLSELNCLSHLFHLELQIRNVETLLTELSIEMGQKLEMFSILAADRSLATKDFGNKRCATTLDFDIKSPIDSIDGVLQILLQKCEKLKVKDSVGFTRLLCNPHENCGYPRLKHLVIVYPVREIENMSPHNFDLQVAFPQLTSLDIESGNNLKALWHNNGLPGNSFGKLRHIYLYDCNKLTCVFPSCMVKSLVFLNTLQIVNCELVERIFEIEESTYDVNRVVPLTSLTLRLLPKLKHVWSNDPAPILLTFPNLKEVYVVKCPQLKTLFPASFINRMKEIETLYFDGGNEIFAEDEASQLMSPEVLLFPSLRVLTIHYSKLMKKRSFWVRPESFPKLQTLWLIRSEDDDMVNSPLEMSALICKSLKRLEIKNASELVHIFQNGEGNNNNDDASSSGGDAKLKSLSLYNLPNLMHVWEDNSDQMSSSCFDILGFIYVTRCEKLKYLLPSSITFFNLTTLWVYNCNGMMNLFECSVAKNLVNLESMEISKCRRMSSIVIAEGGGGEGEDEETISFNKLHDLRLNDLGELLSFHPEKCRLKFPSLKVLRIEDCPEMKTFSYGILTTPKLAYVHIEEREISLSPAKGLNVIIRRRWKDKHVKNLLTQQVSSRMERKMEQIISFNGRRGKEGALKLIPMAKVLKFQLVN